MTGFLRAPAPRLLMLTAGLILATTASALSLDGGDSLFGGDEARLVVLNQQYQTMAECERATAHEPWIVCAETPAWWVNAP